MQLSIIIVNYNVAHYLELCIDSVIKATERISAEIIIVDNASTDQSVAMVANKFPGVQLIANQENLGFSKANNQGAAIASGEYVCILNPDTVVPEDIFLNLLNFSKSRAGLGAIGVQLLDGTGTFLPESKRKVPDIKVAYNKIFGDGSSYYASHIAREATHQVDVLVGAFMFMRRSLYKGVNGFDERYFMYGEDIDLSYTIQKAGYENYYIGQEKVIHFKGESTIKDRTYRQRFYGAMGLFYNKYFAKNGLQHFIVRAGLKCMKLGAFAMPMTKKDTRESKSSVKQYFIVTDREDVVHAFAKAVSQPTHIISKLSNPKEGDEYIFDSSLMTYKEIIRQLAKYAESGATYKIIPKNSTFAVGSNSKEGRGEVISF